MQARLQMVTKNPITALCAFVPCEDRNALDHVKTANLLSDFTQFKKKTEIDFLLPPNPSGRFLETVPRARTWWF